MNEINENIKLHQGDCLEVMDKLIAEGIKVDAIITDPPYGTVQNIGDSEKIQHGMKNKTTWDEAIDSTILFDKCSTAVILIIFLANGIPGKPVKVPIFSQLSNKNS